MKKTLAQILIEEAAVWGIKLEKVGDRLVISPASKCLPEFKELLRSHKLEILALLESKASGLSPDCAPWLHIARQVLAGEFSGADRSTVESLTIGLRSVQSPVCRKALERLIGRAGWKEAA